jgi:hypothetical protein
MTDYTITTNFGAKDSLPSGNAAKVIKGSEFTTEFTNIATAVNSKADTAGDTFTGVVNFSDVTNFNADVAFDTDTLFVDASTDRVGIGTTSPADELHLNASKSGEDVVFRIQNSAVTTGDTATLRFCVTSDVNHDSAFIGSDRSNSLILGSDLQERMRINDDGIVSIGTQSVDPAAASQNTEGIALGGTGYISMTRSGIPMFLNRKGGTGSILKLRKDGADYGTMGTVPSGGVTYFFLGANQTNTGIGFNYTGIYPSNGLGGFADNSRDLGSSSVRWDDIYATNSTIQTSDRNEKQGIRELLDAEQRVATACKGLLRAFKWNSAVEEKGDEARIHFGIIAQDLQDAFTAEGLDAGDYAMFINSTWTDEETGEERSRMGVRYSELLAFIISAILEESE